MASIEAMALKRGETIDRIGAAIGVTLQKQLRSVPNPKEHRELTNLLTIADALEAKEPNVEQEKP